MTSNLTIYFANYSNLVVRQEYEKDHRACTKVTNSSKKS